MTKQNSDEKKLWKRRAHSLMKMTQLVTSQLVKCNCAKDTFEHGYQSQSAKLLRSVGDVLTSSPAAIAAFSFASK